MSKGASAAELCLKPTLLLTLQVPLLPVAHSYCFILRLVILSEEGESKVWQPANVGLSFTALPAACPASCARLPRLQETCVSSAGIPTVQSNGNGPNPGARLAWRLPVCRVLPAPMLWGCSLLFLDFFFPSCLLQPKKLSEKKVFLYSSVRMAAMQKWGEIN